ncbi:hypothetical protein [Stenotrophomonas maltophilia]|uniref:hypothetical protein n=1 Tax=Stenotrophomonas maltophilia TaxID=40324 RepID=UPI000D0DCC3F|nr:hypothetical protein [Stenotrophomonas maltophilia]PSM12089.1 hypothetical protein CV100_18905 [Stenotrophomonas maltophilia]
MKVSIITFGLFAALASASVSAAESNGLPLMMMGAQSCAAAFNQSGASRSCRLTNAQDFANNYCQISAECRRHNDGMGYPIYQGNKSNVARLQNCDGSLRVGGC